MTARAGHFAFWVAIACTGSCKEELTRSMHEGAASSADPRPKASTSVVAASVSPPHAPIPPPVAAKPSSAPSKPSSETTAPPGSAALSAAKPAGAQADRTGSAQCPAGMAFVPAGTFTMGSVKKEPSWFREEQDVIWLPSIPPHKVKVEAYCIDLVQVTHARYQECIRQSVCSAPTKPANQDWETCHWQAADSRDLPVTCVTAHQAEQYCKHVGKRLPTDIEWEYAAKGKDLRVYPWGDRLEPSNNLDCRAVAGEWQLRPVGSEPKFRSAFGLDDMAGSAGDWTGSNLCDYPKHECTGTTLRSVRGGTGEGCFVVHRAGREPTTNDSTISFRCASAPLPNAGQR